MLEQIYYYFILPLTFSAGALGCYFVLQPVKAKQMVSRWSWNASKAYVLCLDLGTKVSSYLDEYIEEESDEHSSDSDCEEENKQHLIMYDSASKNNYIGDIPENKEDCETLVKSISPSIIFIKSKINDVDYYKRTSNPCNTDEVYTTFCEKPFIQIEYIVGDEVLDIHEYLTGFYINENKILDKDFLKWYLYYYYSKELSDDYSLRIFDKDVNMFIIKDNQYIQLNDNSYSVVNEKVDKEYEGATHQ